MIDRLAEYVHGVPDEGGDYCLAGNLSLPAWFEGSNSAVQTVSYIIRLFGKSRRRAGVA